MSDHNLSYRITVDDIDPTLAAIVAGFGEDYVYRGSPEADRFTPPCRYVHGDNKPGCIVAQFLARHGVPMEELARLEGMRPSTGGFLPGRLTPATALVLSHIQRAQDGRATWGDCRRLAQRYISGLRKLDHGVDPE